MIQIRDTSPQKLCSLKIFLKVLSDSVISVMRLQGLEKREKLFSKETILTLQNDSSENKC